ncbi:aromatic amino acid lyase [Rhodobacteraceae bacterium NNCM2]|nr:aromatic amino acid lyase [Coraliihabitans acroporae]
MNRETLLGDGSLTPGDLLRIAEGGPVAASPKGLARMAEGEAVLAREIAADSPIYGVTTGLGPRVVDRLDTKAQQAFPAATIRGRAHAIGRPLETGVVRAAMAVRAHTLMSGATGVRPGLAEHVIACLNAGLTPVVGETATIGAADLMWGGMIGLGLIGEGEVDTETGRKPAAQAFAEAGLPPWEVAPREGLALASNSATMAALSAIGLARMEQALAATQGAAALSLEGFRANLSPIDPDIIALSPKPGQDRAAQGLRRWLEGSGLYQPGAARRLQDPLSLRNIVQVQGAVFASAGFLEAAVMPEINYPTDNPVVLIERETVLSGGSYLSPQLAIAVQAMNDAARHMAAQTVSRIAKILANRFSALPAGLTHQGAGGAGYGAMMKVVETLYAEIAHLAQPAPVYPSPSADGLEDTITHGAIPAKALLSIVEKVNYLTAIELMVATQAVEMREVAPSPALADVMARVRRIAAPLTTERSLSAEIEALAAEVAKGALPGS